MASPRVFRHYVSDRSLVLLLGDVFVLTASLYLVEWLRVVGSPGARPDLFIILPRVAVFVLLGILTLYVAGLYDHSPHMGRKELAVHVMAASVVWVILYEALGCDLPYLDDGSSGLHFGVRHRDARTDRTSLAPFVLPHRPRGFASACSSWAQPPWRIR